MNCPRCNAPDTQVIDSRLIEDGAAVRRRRQCSRCGLRFTTHERLVRHSLWVIKKDGRRELFDRQKVELGMMKACEKRPVTPEQIRRAAEEIELALQGRGVRQVTSREIGDMVMAKLLELDDVAYIRFASVYQEFDDARRFAEALAALQKRKRQRRIRRRRTRRK
ncbi:Transcriptional repressor NrdR [bacterium HR17]|uniref:Transcriptional repressor NrdR n=1 Tax=Candidatus Fervidibacter japonicus TaxID=2035412 RepID=A0A2H5XD68_9BACT|nr:Transcriptional repressor NrdR [bacterium HR17]